VIERVAADERRSTRGHGRRHGVLRAVASSAVFVMAIGSCSPASNPVTPASSAGNGAALASRVEELSEAVQAWADSETIEDAHVWAEAALNLVVGPNGPGYGDLNDDGSISGESDAGVLPGLDGTPAGLASSLGSNPCIERDVLGGDWTDPEQQWATMSAAIEAWSPANNTMPSLPSHPMRIVGWATFTLESDSLDLAHEYASHARLHVDVTQRALDC
jgi:hypothetical protein